MHTKGPWRWRVNQESKYILLKGGDKIVMDFVRYGMNSAMPRFRSERDLMVKSNTLAVNISGEEHHSRWNQDIDHPDARLVAAAPDLLEALKNVISFYPYTHIDTDTPEGCAYHQAKLAIEKAEGG